MSRFQKAVRKQAKLKLGLTGPSGSGKTYSAIILARQLGKRIAVMDSENGSASLYTHLADFDTMDMRPPHTPESYIDAIHDAEAAGYDVLIIDSVTHEWSGPGGCLEINEKIAQAKYRGNGWAAWNDTTPRHRKLLDTIVGSPLHIIVTMRSKTETAQVDDGNRKKVVKLGMKAEQRDGFEYELSVVLDIVHQGHFALASKDRTGLFTDKDPAPITDATGKALVAWLNSGATLAPEQPLSRGLPGDNKPVPPPTTQTQPAQPSSFERAIAAIKGAKTPEALGSIGGNIDQAVQAGRIIEDQRVQLMELWSARMETLSAALEEAPI